MPTPAIAPAFTLELPYAADSSRWFAVLSGTPWSLFLDSSRPYSDQGRFDIMAADPRITLVTRGALTEITDRGEIQVSAADPFELLRDVLGHKRAFATQLPFVGGAAGYFGYDLARRIERLPQRSRDETGMPDMALGIYDWAVVVDHQDRRAWLASSSGGERRARYWDELIALLEGGRQAAEAEGFRQIGPLAVNLDLAAYAEAFRRVQRYIREGDCYQVNLARRFRVSARGDAWDLYSRLRQVNPAPFGGFMRYPWGCVLSSSPERFLRVGEGLVETRPIKGTRRRDPDPDRDRALAGELLNSEKDRAENLMIVDLLRNDLGRCCLPGSVEVPELFKIESFSRVHHMVSTIRGRLRRDQDALHLLRACFPGGSITGAPKIRAMEIIEELEPCRRSVYCGALGYLGFDGRMDTNIAIRTLLYDGRNVRFWAGGGIVRDSQMQAEFQETLDKVAAVLDLLQDSEQ